VYEKKSQECSERKGPFWGNQLWRHINSTVEKRGLSVRNNRRPGEPNREGGQTGGRSIKIRKKQHSNCKLGSWKILIQKKSYNLGSAGSRPKRIGNSVHKRDALRRGKLFLEKFVFIRSLITWVI